MTAAMNPLVAAQERAEALREAFPDALLADGLHDALVGFGTQFNRDVAVYDLERAVAILVERDGMTPDEAEECLEVNTLGAYVGLHTPVFIHRRVDGPEDAALRQALATPWDDEDDEPDQDEPYEDPVQADADVLRSAGMGTDEDYGGWPGDDGSHDSIG